MRLVIFLVVAGWISACSGSDPEGTGRCYTLIERQCAMDPFYPFLKGAIKEDEKAAGIKKYLEANGILNAAVRGNPVSTNAVCQACGCPNGYTYQLKIADSDTARLNTLNISLTARNCD
jgi:hypothetical protein